MKKIILAAFLISSLSLVAKAQQDMTQVIGAQFKARSLSWVIDDLKNNNDDSVKVRTLFKLENLLPGKIGATYITFDTLTVGLIFNWSRIIGRLPQNYPAWYQDFKTDLLPLRSAYPTLNTAIISDSLSNMNDAASYILQFRKGLTNQ